MTEETKKQKLNDSFDDFPEGYEPNGDVNYEKNVYAVPSKKKAERKNYIGFSCDDCKGYYQSLGLPEKDVKDLVQQCSKHRLPIPPPPKSPKGTIYNHLKFDSCRHILPFSG